ncbi:CBS domain-containing protein [Acidisphaera sp. S103]|uniref:CBS domain-containing protein n=1 Tax=Acidisphaera sp. S103 TaxID=1747223 RepID=UPI00131DDF96|nr:CBS domain-containing protein [Acidisphaera sp. S103]
MIVADVMTRHCITIAPDATVEEAVNLMLSRHISGLFVVDKAGDLAGVITEGDLLRRDELGTQRNRPWWLRLLASPARQAADFTRANGRHVRDVMTEDVISIAQDAPLEGVVAAMEANRIKRLPVTADGKVVGVVSRTDLLRALIGRARTSEPLPTDDRTIRAAIMNALEAQSWAPMTTLNVTVANAVADVWGTITNEEERRAIHVVVENTRGVKAVHDHMVYIEPYTGTVIDAPDERS